MMTRTEAFKRWRGNTYVFDELYDLCATFEAENESLRRGLKQANSDAHRAEWRRDVCRAQKAQLRANAREQLAVALARIAELEEQNHTLLKYAGSASEAISEQTARHGQDQERIAELEAQRDAAVWLVEAVRSGIVVLEGI